MARLIFSIPARNRLKLGTDNYRARYNASSTQLRLVAHLTLAVLLFFGHPVYAQQQITQEQVVRDPQSVSLLQHAWNLMGGSKWSSAGSVQLSGTLDTYQAKQQSGEFTLSVALSGDTNIGVTDREGKTSSYSRKGSGMTSTRAGEAEKSQPLQITLSLPPYFPLELIHKALNDSTWSIIPTGTSSVNSASCTEVELKHIYPLSSDPNQILSKFTERRLCIDAQSGLVDRISLKAYSPTNIRTSVQRTLDYAGYRQIGPYLMPSSVTDNLHGQTYLHMTVTSANSQ